MTPENRTYFDHYQHDPDREPLAIGGLTTLDSVYAYRPVPAELADVSERVLGTQGQLWGEYLPTSADITGWRSRECVRWRRWPGALRPTSADSPGGWLGDTWADCRRWG